MTRSCPRRSPPWTTLRRARARSAPSSGWPPSPVVPRGSTAPARTPSRCHPCPQRRRERPAEHRADARRGPHRARRAHGRRRPERWVRRGAVAPHELRRPVADPARGAGAGRLRHGDRGARCARRNPGSDGTGRCRLGPRGRLRRPRRRASGAGPGQGSGRTPASAAVGPRLRGRGQGGRHRGGGGRRGRPDSAGQRTRRTHRRHRHHRPGGRHRESAEPARPAARPRGQGRRDRRRPHTPWAGRWAGGGTVRRDPRRPARGPGGARHARRLRRERPRSPARPPAGPRPGPELPDRAARRHRRPHAGQREGQLHQCHRRHAGTTGTGPPRPPADVSTRQAVRGVAGAAALIAGLTVLARLAGFGRTLAFTNTVGADSTGDTYVAANTVPNIVFEIVAGGALASLVVPMLAAGIAAGNHEQVRGTASALLGWTVLVLAPLAVVIALFAEPIASLLLAGRGPDEVALASRFLLVFAPQVVLYGIGIVLTGVLQAHRRFAGPAIAPLLSSLVVAGAYLLFAGMGGAREVDRLSTPAELVLGVGTTLGVVALSLSLLVPLRRLRLGLRPSLRFPVGAAPRVRRLALAGILTLAGQQLVAVAAIRLTGGDAPDGSLVVYGAGLTLFLVPWAALAVPLATSSYPGLSERAELGDDTGYARALAPVTALVVTATAGAAALLIAVAGPIARVFLSSGTDAGVAALRDTTIAFAPGLVGYGLVAVLTRALYAQGIWKAPTVCVVGGWLVATVADVVLAGALPAADRAAALGAGHTLGVTVAGIALLVVVARTAPAGSL